MGLAGPSRRWIWINGRTLTWSAAGSACPAAGDAASPTAESDWPQRRWTVEATPRHDPDPDNRPNRPQTPLAVSTTSGGERSGLGPASPRPTAPRVASTRSLPRSPPSCCRRCRRSSGRGVAGWIRFRHGAGALRAAGQGTRGAATTQRHVPDGLSGQSERRQVVGRAFRYEPVSAAVPAELQRHGPEREPGYALQEGWAVRSPVVVPGIAWLGLRGDATRRAGVGTGDRQRHMPGPGEARQAGAGPATGARMIAQCVASTLSRSSHDRANHASGAS